MFLRSVLNGDIGFLVGKPFGDVFFELRMGGNGKMHPVPAVVVIDDFHKRVFLVFSVAHIVDVGIKQRCRLQFRHEFLEHPVIDDRFRNAAGGEDRVELSAVAQPQPVFPDILDHHFSVFIPFILRRGKFIFNASDIAAVRSDMPGHCNLGGIHVVVIDRALFRVGDSFRFRLGLCLHQGYLLADILVPVGQNLIGVKAENVLIPNAVGDAVAVQFAAEDGGGRVHFLLVFLLNGRSGKTEEDGGREGVLDGEQHIAECGTVRLVDDENNAFRLHQCEVMGVESFRLVFDIAHFLDGGHDQGVGRVGTFQLAHQYAGVFRRLHILAVVREAAIFEQ
ncbi:hypothetical protein SDC9_101844 [bioreactor metagenome]|uniref:Uncharacterized protein n=1 Tax=bioreactor metagenome TaxID=1076179 RepID=A0A645APQ1_9ZZZZ